MNNQPEYTYPPGTNIGIQKYADRVVSGFRRFSYPDKETGELKYGRAKTHGKSLWIWTGWRWVKPENFERDVQRDFSRANRK